MAQKKIPASAYIIIGSAMVLMSVFVDVEKLAIFVFAGALFILVGFFKVLVKQHKETKHTHHTRHAAHKPAKHKQPKSAHKPTSHTAAKHHPVHHTTIVRCSSCGVKIHPLFKFCPNCGQKLK